MKTFEMSAYGVEEMNAQEIEAVNGGWGWIWPVVGAIAAAVSAIVAVYDSASGGGVATGGGASGSTGAYGADSVIMHPDGTTGIYGADSVIIRLIASYQSLHKFDDKFMQTLFVI